MIAWWKTFFSVFEYFIQIIIGILDIWTVVASSVHPLSREMWYYFMHYEIGYIILLEIN